jgi:hypothetical protein
VAMPAHPRHPLALLGAIHGSAVLRLERSGAQRTCDGRGTPGHCTTSSVALSIGKPSSPIARAER